MVKINILHFKNKRKKVKMNIIPAEIKNQIISIIDDETRFILSFVNNEYASLVLNYYIECEINNEECDVVKSSKTIIFYAAKNSYLNILKWIRYYDNKWPVNEAKNNYTCYFLLSNSRVDDNQYINDVVSKRVGLMCANNGDIEMLKYIYSEGYKIGTLALAHILYVSSSKGHLSIVKWLHENKFIKYDGSSYDGAIEGEKIHIIEFLKLNNYPINEKAEFLISKNNIIKDTNLNDENTINFISNLINGENTINFIRGCLMGVSSK